MEGLDWTSYDAVLFDLDGVVTPTAALHRRAWTELFAAWDFTNDDYLTYVDGRPRYDGVRTFLVARGVNLPEGDPSDPAGDGSVCALGNRKDDIFMAMLTSDGIEPYAGTMAVVAVLDGASIPQAIVSSSRNARAVLAAAGLEDRFGVVVDGVVADELSLPGKPNPDMFLHAASLLGVQPDSTAVVEDAMSGVAAGVAGGFGFVLGVDRGGNHDALVEHGAHAVVEDLGETLEGDGS